MSRYDPLWSIVTRQFPMGAQSHHGPKHWRRVFEFGRRLAESTGADPELMELFAIFHDSRRINDAVDEGHGQRGADLALEYHGRYFSLEPERLKILVEACREHTAGRLSDHPTIGACWDSDRLDLWRVGIYPKARYMSTEEARKEEVIAWAVSRSAPA